MWTLTVLAKWRLQGAWVVSKKHGVCVIALTPNAPIKPLINPVKPDNLRALALMALGMFMFSGADAIAKYLTSSLHPVQIVWSRQMGLMIGVVILLSMRGFDVLKTDHPRLQILRGGLAALSATMFITAVRYIPLADAVAISFVAPFVVTLLGALILREKVGIRRWTAVLIGFAGTLIVIRPGTGAMHPAGFLVLGGASLFAIRQILSRLLAASDRTSTTVAYTAIVATAILTVPLLFVWRTPESAQQWLLLVGLAMSGALGELLVIKSLEIGEAVAVAPVQYSLILWGTMYGWLVFHQWPDVWTWVGAAIIVATGLYTFHRERVVARQRRQQIN